MCSWYGLKFTKFFVLQKLDTQIYIYFRNIYNPQIGKPPTLRPTKPQTTKATKPTKTIAIKTTSTKFLIKTFYNTLIFCFILKAPQFVTLNIYLSVPLVILFVGIALTIFVIYYMYGFLPYVGAEYKKKNAQRSTPNKTEKF